MTTDVSQAESCCGVEEISLEEGRRLLDDAARRILDVDFRSLAFAHAA